LEVIQRASKNGNPAYSQVVKPESYSPRPNKAFLKSLGMSQISCISLQQPYTGQLAYLTSQILTEDIMSIFAKIQRAIHTIRAASFN